MYRRMTQILLSLFRRLYRHSAVRIIGVLLVVVIILHLFIGQGTHRVTKTTRREKTERTVDRLYSQKLSVKMPERHRTVHHSIDTVARSGLGVTLSTATPRRNLTDISIEKLCDKFERPSVTVEPLRWQSVAGRNVTVFSAYADRRRSAGGPLVRVIASGLQAEYNNIGVLYCRMWFAKRAEAVVVGPAKYDLIYPSMMYASMWVAHFIICPVAADGPGGGSMPELVSIADKPCETPASNVLRVLNSDRLRSRLAHDTAHQISASGQNATTYNRRRVDSVSFALCLPALYGRRTSEQMLIEWIELHALLGVKEIILYNMTTSPDVAKVLRSYTKDATEGRSGSVRLKVIPWQFTATQNIDHFNQHEALNDCVYRAALHHDYVAVNDIDEVLVPRDVGGWPKFIAGMRRKSTDADSVGAYLFQHAYFREQSTTEMPGTLARRPTSLVTMKCLWRTDVVTPPGNIRSKALYNTRKVVKVNIHYPYALVPNSTQHLVDPQIGMLHHYRSEPMESFAKQPQKYRYVKDVIMLRYNNALESAVQYRRIRAFNSTGV